MSYEHRLEERAERIRTLRACLPLIDMPGMTIDADGIYDAASGCLISVEMPDGKLLSVDQVEAGLQALGLDDPGWKRALGPSELGEMLHDLARDEEYAEREYAASIHEHAAE